MDNTKTTYPFNCFIRFWSTLVRTRKPMDFLLIWSDNCWFAEGKSKKTETELQDKKAHYWLVLPKNKVATFYVSFDDLMKHQTCSLTECIRQHYQRFPSHWCNVVVILFWFVCNAYLAETQWNQSFLIYFI